MILKSGEQIMQYVQGSNYVSIIADTLAEMTVWKTWALYG